MPDPELTQAESKVSNSDRIAEQYLRYLQEFTSGPQIEGLSPDELEGVLRDKSTKYLDINNVALPFLAAMRHAYWLNPQFFDKRGYDTNSLMYCIVPQSLLKAIDSAPQKAVIDSANSEFSSLDLIIDFPEGGDLFYEDLDASYTVDDLLTENGTPAAVYYFRTMCTPNSEALAAFQEDTQVRSIPPTRINDYAERIWEIYEKQFQPLVDDHPVNGMLPKEDLLHQLSSPSTRVKAYFDDNDILQSFGYIVDDFKACPWLNQDYFSKAADGTPLVYMPGIATDADFSKPVSGKILASIFAETSRMYDKFMMVGECSNKSAEYIPRLVTRAFERSGLISYTPIQETKHFYKVVSFKNEPQG